MDPTEIVNVLKDGFERMLRRRGPEYWIKVGALLVVSLSIVAGATSYTFDPSLVPNDEYYELVGARTQVTFDAATGTYAQWQLKDAGGNILWSSKPVTNTTNNQVTVMQLTTTDAVQANWTPRGETGTPTQLWSDNSPHYQVDPQTGVALFLVTTAAITTTYVYLIFKRRRKSKMPAEMTAIQ